jgi:hypothetical protein
MAIATGTALALLAAAGAAQGAGSAISAGKKNKSEEALARDKIASDERMHGIDTALEESTLNPFRQQMAQAGSLSTLDRLERGSYSPVRLAPSGPYASSVPSMTGGYSYEKSPELTASAGALKRDVMSGHTAPSVLAPPSAPPTPGRTRPPMSPPVGMATPRTPAPASSTAVLDLLTMLYGENAPVARRRPMARV